MAEVMYALKAQEVEPKPTYGLIAKIRYEIKHILKTAPTKLRYGLYYIGTNPSDNINTVLTAIEASTPKELGYRIVREWDEIVNKSGTKNITFEKSEEFPEKSEEFPNMSEIDKVIIEYYEMSKKERKAVKKKMYEAKDIKIRDINSVNGSVK